MTKHQWKQTRQSVLYMCRLTFKSLAVIIGASYALLFAFTHIPQAGAATLVPEVQVNDTVVRLSDLFTDLPMN